MVKNKAEATINNLFVSVLATVKQIEKTIPESVDAKLDPRMQKALEIFDTMKILPPVQKAASSLGIDLSLVNVEEIANIFEKILHASKLSLSVDAAKELQQIVVK